MASVNSVILDQTARCAVDHIIRLGSMNHNSCYSTGIVAKYRALVSTTTRCSGDIDEVEIVPVAQASIPLQSYCSLSLLSYLDISNCCYYFY